MIENYNFKNKVKKFYKLVILPNNVYVVIKISESIPM